MLRTKDIWTPRPRCNPAQERQMKVPNLGEAHCGEGALQSTQVVFPGSFWRVRSCPEWEVRLIVEGMKKEVIGGYLALGLRIYLPHYEGQHMDIELSVDELRKRLS